MVHLNEQECESASTRWQHKKWRNNGPNRMYSSVTIISILALKYHLLLRNPPSMSTPSTLSLSSQLSIHLSPSGFFVLFSSSAAASPFTLAFFFLRRMRISTMCSSCWWLLCLSTRHPWSLRLIKEMASGECSPHMHACIKGSVDAPNNDFLFFCYLHSSLEFNWLTESLKPILKYSLWKRTTFPLLCQSG